MKYRFTRGFAKASIAIGAGCITLGVAASALMAIAVLFAPNPNPRLLADTARPMAAVAIALVGAAIGLLIGAPYIVAGQVLLVFLDQRWLLANIERHLRPDREVGSNPVAERLLSRR